MESVAPTTDLTVPILMYHKVGAPVHSKNDSRLNVSARDFERQMRLLRRLGYTGITFQKTIEGLTGISPLPRKPVCITFDDGYECVAEHASPILADFGWPGVIFAPTAFVGQANTWDMD